MNKEHYQPPDDSVLIEQERAESLQEYIVVIRDNRKSAPIQYVKIIGSSVQDAINETKKVVPDSVTILKAYPSK